MGTDMVGWVGVAVDAFTPLTLFALGFLGKRFADGLERRRQLSAVATSWRLEVFRELVGHLNELYCYFNYVGEWRSMSPEDATSAKRSCDRLFYMNRFLWSAATIESYRVFVQTAFLEELGPGQEFRFKANVNRHKENPNWSEEWARRFVDPQQRVTRDQFNSAYDSFLWSAVRDLGVVST